MRRLRKQLRGQSATEFALILPIVVFLLYLIAQAFNANHQASDQSIRLHAETLEAFNHGNSGAIVVDGIELIPGRFGQIIPPGASFDPSDIGKNLLPDLIRTVGLNALFSNVNWFNSDGFWRGVASGAITTAVDNVISTGTLDPKAVAWGGLAGGLSSGSAGEKFGKAGGKFMGSALQQGSVAFAQSQGDWKAAPGGMVTGVFASEGMQGWSGNHEVLSGALKGALTSSVAGAFNGELDLRQVAVATGMGAFNTNKVAGHFTKNERWSGDPQGTAAFSATSGFLSTILNGGDLTAALIASADGAFFSAQFGDVLDGKDGTTKGGRAFDSFQTMMGSAGYGALKGAALGEGSDGIMAGVMNSMMSSAMSQAQAKARQRLNEAIETAQTRKEAEEVFGRELRKDEYVTVVKNGPLTTYLVKTIGEEGSEIGELVADASATPVEEKEE